MKLSLVLSLAGNLSHALAYQPQILNASSSSVQHAPLVQRWGSFGPPRPADDDLWYKAHCKGNGFHRAFGLSDQQAGAFWNPPRASAYSGWKWDHLGPWGYNMYSLNFANRDFGGASYGVARALRELGKSDKAREDGGTIDVVQAYHGVWNGVPGPNGLLGPDQQTYTAPDGYTRRVTGGSFIFGIDPTQGVLITMNRESPKYAARKRNPPVPANQLPHLSSSSDVMWAVWEDYAGPGRVNNLQWWFSISIANEETRQVIKRALDAQGLQLGPYPGVFLSMATDEAQAILGSPNGMGLGYFLLQHKPKLGNMYVSGVVVFHGDTLHRSPCLAFAVAPPMQAPGGAMGLADSEQPPMPSLPKNFTWIQEALKENHTETPVTRNRERTFMFKRSGEVIQVA